MIILLYGQPNSGKTTIAHQLQHEYFLKYVKKLPIVDGDAVRNIFKNKDYSERGRIRNLERISDIATYMSQNSNHVIVAAVYPYKASRNYLYELNNGRVLFVELIYKEKRGRENYHVDNFEYDLNEFPNVLKLNTDVNDVKSCVKQIIVKLEEHEQ